MSNCGFDGVPHTWAITRGVLASRVKSLTSGICRRSRPHKTLSRRSRLPCGFMVPRPCRLKALPVNLIGSKVVCPRAIVNATSAESNAVFPGVRGLSGGEKRLLAPRLSAVANRSTGPSSPKSPSVMWASVAYIVDSAKIGTAYGLMTMIQNIGLFGLNLLIGWANDYSHAGPDNPGGYNLGMWIFSTLGFLGMLFAFLLRQRETGPHGHGLETITTAKSAV